MLMQGETATTWGVNQGTQKSNRWNRRPKTQITIHEIIKSGTTLESLFVVSNLTAKGPVKHRILYIKKLSPLTL